MKKKEAIYKDCDIKQQNPKIIKQLLSNKTFFYQL